MLVPTPPDRMVDAQGRPYFLWDVDMTLDELTRQLAEADLPVRAYLTGKVMRQAKPDDALQFISAQQMADLWPHLEKYLGNKRDFWSWLIEEWKRWNGQGVAPRFIRHRRSDRERCFTR